MVSCVCRLTAVFVDLQHLAEGMGNFNVRSVAVNGMEVEFQVV